MTWYWNDKLYNLITLVTKNKNKMTETKRQKLYWQSKIIAELKKKGILGFLVEEISDSLNYLNSYKVKNVYENLDLLIADLSNIQTNYIREVLK